MKVVTPSEARRQWFRLLDEAADGEVIVVPRHGCRLVLRREEVARTRRPGTSAEYRRLLKVPRANEADRWGWTWGKGKLRFEQRPRR